MRYTYHPSDDGRFFILDTLFDLTILWVGNEDIAKTACNKFNKDYEASLTKTD